MERGVQEPETVVALVETSLGLVAALMQVQPLLKISILV